MADLIGHWASENLHPYHTITIYLYRKKNTFDNIDLSLSFCLLPKSIPETLITVTNSQETFSRVELIWIRNVEGIFDDLRHKIILVA